MPLRRIYIPKKNGKLRPLGIPTMLDRAMQATWLMALDPVAEATADRNSYGFRKERSCADAIEQCYIALARKTSPQWVLEGDIKACFDRINHDWLLAHVPLPGKGRRRVAQWLRAGYMERDILYATEEGTPQGGIISPALANLALDGLEAVLGRKFSPKNWVSWRNQIHLIRYADDFVITCRSKEMLENEVLPLVSSFMAERGLELSSEKTVITHIEDGFDFLGQNVRKYDGKLIITPSRKNVSSFLENVRGVVKANRASAAGRLIRELNPKITGWANYHRHVCSAETFQDVDTAVFRALWRWALRRHPNKSRRWVKERYYRYIPGPAGGTNWGFFGTLQERSGTSVPVVLRCATATRIRRHVKIRSEVNPYHPAWWSYLADRHRQRQSTPPGKPSGRAATQAMPVPARESGLR